MEQIISSSPGGIEHRARWFRIFASLCASASLLVGVCVIVGWLADIDVLKRIRPGFAAMNPTTAGLFILAGASFRLLIASKPFPSGRAVGRVLATIILAAAVTRLIGQFVPWARIDQVFLGGLLRAEPLGSRNGMARNTAAAFALLGIALLLLRPRGHPAYWIYAAITLVISTFASLALIAYFYGVSSFDGGITLADTAVHTAILLLLLSLALLAIRTDRGIGAILISDHSGGRIARWLLPATVIIVVSTGFLRLEAQRNGIFGDEFGGAFKAVFTVGLMTAMIWYAAAALNRVDRHHHAAKKALEDTRTSLHESNEMLEAILDSAGDGIIVVDSQGRVLHRNPAANRILGALPSGVPSLQTTGGPNLRLPDMVTPFPIDRLALVGALQGVQVNDQEQFFASDQDQPARWLSVSAQALRDRNPPAAIAVIRDISHRKHNELLAASQRDVLEKMVELRTADLVRSNQELEQFAYVASHDLQEPLRMVGSFLQLLERRYKDRFDNDASEFIGFAVDGAKRMKQLISDLLQFSRVDRSGAEFISVSPATILRNVITDYDVLIKETGAEVTADHLPASITADEGLIHQLLQNLVGNAIKFRSDAPPKVRVYTFNRNGETVFAVSDNGIGISPEHFEQIFVIFQRLHVSDRYPGTGIGLAICKKIVERHGGRIWVESQPGSGSTFCFTLPTPVRSMS